MLRQRDALGSLLRTGLTRSLASLASGIGAGQEGHGAALSRLTTLASILAQIAALPSFGVIGVAIVSSLSRVLTYSLLCWRYAFKTGLDPTIFDILRLGPVRGDRTAPPTRHIW